MKNASGVTKSNAKCIMHRNELDNRQMEKSVAVT